MFTTSQRRRMLASHVTEGIQGDYLFKGKSHFSAADFTGLFKCNAYTVWSALKIFFLLLDVPLKAPLKLSTKILPVSILYQEIEDYFLGENSENTIQPLIKLLRSKYCRHAQKGDSPTEIYSIDQVYFTMRGKLGIDITYGAFMQYIIRYWPANKQICFKCYRKFDPLLVDLFCEICQIVHIGGSTAILCGGRRWWNNFQIDQLQAHWQKKFANDKFFLTTSADLLLHPNDHSNHHILLNPNKLAPQRFSIIVNHDISTGRGTHWCGIFINGKTKELFYFDSCASKKIPCNIMDFLWLFIKAKWRLTVSVIKQQQGDTECGTYCLYYSYLFMRGLSINKLAAMGRKDSIIEKFRDIKY